MSFKARVHSIVKKIPKGKTLTYKEVAKRAGSPRAFRAVGTVLSKNFDPAIPCHRVIRSDGGMGGYNRGGITAKIAILTGEWQNSAYARKRRTPQSP
ncbi:MGMT family protein [Candidatus Parcubacteria bacterium]|nr:MGMT family protein [Candidatus Parcubacteria bacterium]